MLARIVCGLVGLVVVASLALVPPSATLGAGAAPGKPVRIGTLDAPAVAMAYFRSSEFAGRIRALATQREEAKAAGDKAKVKELNAKGEAEQKLAHTLVFDGKKLDRLRDLMAGVWPRIAEAANVDAIVIGTLYEVPGVEVVDVTEAALKELGADDQTRKYIAEMKAKRGDD